MCLFHLAGLYIIQQQKIIGESTDRIVELTISGQLCGQSRNSRHRKETKTAKYEGNRYQDGDVNLQNYE
jgi:hypothetical protein